MKTTKDIKDKDKALEQVLADIERQFGKGAIMKLGAQEHMEIEATSSGSLALDIALGVGGYPKGRIIEICKKLGTDIYINPCGGRSLYRHSDFEEEGIELFFLETKKENIIYKQRQDIFVENLSVIDILMYNDKQTVRNFLSEYALKKWNEI